MEPSKFINIISKSCKTIVKYKKTFYKPETNKETSKTWILSGILLFQSK